MKRQAAFTLIEIVIALFIFAIMASIVSVALYTTFNARDAAMRYADRLAKLQIALTLMAQDISQNCLTSGITLYGNDQTISAITRAGYVNPNMRYPRGELQTVTYFLKDNTLYRGVITQKGTLQPHVDRPLLTGVESMQFEYVTSDKQRINEWPSPNVKTARGDTLPIAITVKLDIKDWGKISMTFQNPAGDA